jgi:hypothetical protein
MQAELSTENVASVFLVPSAGTEILRMFLELALPELWLNFELCLRLLPLQIIWVSDPCWCRGRWRFQSYWLEHVFVGVNGSRRARVYTGGVYGIGSP